ncbi:glycosyltransferase [Methylosinus sp. R-45379]|uniref:glycosyltransferase n=1 Tax=Methylosinus sp. R-45379 TaxID=980563 RepID=UPI0018DB06BD|nr:glycosyltransferase [Methylosinus sp. R-45379]
MAEHVGDGSIVIPNPYDDAVFFLLEDAKPRNSVVFVGRLIHAKGCHVLLQALAILDEQGICVECTIIGDGPERERLQDLAYELNLSRLRFVGYLVGDLLADELRNHSVMAIPSIWPEPFGVVALEGIAAGCVAVASDVGGLPEALGDCGLLVPPNNPRALADGLTVAMNMNVDADDRGRHLSSHQKRCVGESYLRQFERKIMGLRA